MELQFTSSRRNFEKLFAALLLGAVLCNILAALDWLHLIPFALIGGAVLLIPQNRKLRYVLCGVLALWLLFRFSSLLDGGKQLANRMFEQSQQTQSYEYDYFAVSGQSAAETVLWLSILTGTLCALWGNKVSIILCGLWMAAMAYFGVTPGIFWLTALLIAAFLNVLPRQQRWFYSLIVGVLAVGIAFAAIKIAPEPIQSVSALDDRLRDALASAPMTYEQTPIPTEVPEPEIVPQPETELKQPDHGVQKAPENILFLVLAGLTLMLLFIPAIVKDRAAKKSEKARKDLHDADHGAAIRAMYLYAQRWRKLSPNGEEIPEEVYAIWQEAAFSDHTMGKKQREKVYAYMKKTAEKIWAEADWKRRLYIRYRVCL